MDAICQNHTTAAVFLGSGPIPFVQEAEYAKGQVRTNQ